MHAVCIETVKVAVYFKAVADTATLPKTNWLSCRTAQCHCTMTMAVMDAAMWVRTDRLSCRKAQYYWTMAVAVKDTAN
jgi:hypothetical protein